MKNLAPLFFTSAIALLSSECFAQESRNSIGVGYEHTRAASSGTRSSAATIEVQLPIGDSRFSRLYSMSFGADESPRFYGRAPGGLVLSGFYLIVLALDRGTLPDVPHAKILKFLSLVPDGLSFDLTRTDKLRAGVYGDFFTFDYRGGDMQYTPDVGMRSDFQISERTFLFAKGAAKHFNHTWGPQLTVGIGRKF